MAKPIVEMLIETATLELPDTKTITLRWPEGYEVDFRTGQFITLCWPDDPQVPSEPIRFLPAPWTVDILT